MELKGAAEDADMDKVDRLIEKIREIDNSLADEMANLGSEFEYGAISRMIHESMKENRDCPARRHHQKGSARSLQ